MADEPFQNFTPLLTFIKRISQLCPPRCVTRKRLSRNNLTTAEQASMKYSFVFVRSLISSWSGWFLIKKTVSSFCK